MKPLRDLKKTTNNIFLAMKIIKNDSIWSTILMISICNIFWCEKLYSHIILIVFLSIILCQERSMVRHDIWDMNDMTWEMVRNDMSDMTYEILKL